ncbi:MAG: LETM1 domain-containing protein [Proteobacteria bacterium]|nr:LETM1 domain-containing protein [Pseudomonadota bacterium]
MIKHLITSQIKKNIDLITNETREIEGFTKLLMKHRNSGVKWTQEEKSQLKHSLRRIAMYVPILFVFLLPFGTLLLPVLAESLDRRKAKRAAINQDSHSL